MDSTKATAANGIEQRAKLEQELESIIDHWCETGGQSVIELMNDLRPIVAAALAACAREATETAIQAFGGCLCTCDETPHLRACNVVIATNLRERAVGESK